MPDEVITPANVKDKLEEMSKLLHTFQQRQDEKKGAEKDRIDEVDQRLADLIAEKKEMTDRFKRLEAAMKRPGYLESDDKEEIKQAHLKAWNQLMRSGRGDEAVLELETKLLETQSDPAGGYYQLPPETADFVASRVFETSPLRQVARVQTIGAESLEIVIDDDEADHEWVGEGSGGTNNTDTPELGLINITAHEEAARPRATNKMLEDGRIDIAGWLQDKLVDIFTRKENTAFVVGDGAGKPRGFTTLPAWSAAGVYERNALEQIDSGSNSTFTAEGLIELQGSLKEPYQNGAVFGMKRASFTEVLKLRDTTNGRFLLNNGLDGDGNQSMLLLQKPVIFMDDMPAIAQDALAAVYGNFGVGYTIVDRIGIDVLRDPFSNKGKVEFYTRKRVGGGVTNFDAIKLHKITA